MEKQARIREKAIQETKTGDVSVKKKNNIDIRREETRSENAEKEKLSAKNFHNSKKSIIIKYWDSVCDKLNIDPDIRKKIPIIKNKRTYSDVPYYTSPSNEEDFGLPDSKKRGYIDYIEMDLEYVKNLEKNIIHEIIHALADRYQPSLIKKYNFYYNKISKEKKESGYRERYADIELSLEGVPFLAEMILTNTQPHEILFAATEEEKILNKTKAFEDWSYCRAKTISYYAAAYISLNFTEKERLEIVEKILKSPAETAAKELLKFKSLIEKELKEE